MIYIKNIVYLEIYKQKQLKDIIILMNIDNSDHSLFSGADRLNQITFFENWAKGIRQLTDKLKKNQNHGNDSYVDIRYIEYYENQY